MYFYFQLFILRKKPTHPSLNQFNRLSFTRPSSSVFPPIEQSSVKSLLQQCVLISIFTYFLLIFIIILCFIILYYVMLYIILFIIYYVQYILLCKYIYYYVSIYNFFLFNVSVCGRARVGVYTYNIQCKIIKQYNK